MRITSTLVLSLAVLFWPGNILAAGSQELLLVRQSSINYQKFCQEYSKQSKDFQKKYRGVYLKNCLKLAQRSGRQTLTEKQLPRSVVLDDRPISSPPTGLPAENGPIHLLEGDAPPIPGSAEDLLSRGGIESEMELPADTLPLIDPMVGPRLSPDLVITDVQQRQEEPDRGKLYIEVTRLSGIPAPGSFRYRITEAGIIGRPGFWGPIEEGTATLESDGKARILTETRTWVPTRFDLAAFNTYKVEISINEDRAYRESNYRNNTVIHTPIRIVNDGYPRAWSAWIEREGAEMADLTGEITEVRRDPYGGLGGTVAFTVRNVGTATARSSQAKIVVEESGFYYRYSEHFVSVWRLAPEES